MLITFKTLQQKTFKIEIDDTELVRFSFCTSPPLQQSFQND